MVDTDLIWLIAGFVLVIAEILTGTFYLLVLGIGGFAGAMVAFLKFDFWVQALAAAVVTVAGALWVRGRHSAGADPQMASMDVGQSVSFDSWANQGAGHARVRYRDTLWDAEVEGDTGAPAHGELFYIVAAHGNTLRISRNKP